MLNRSHEVVQGSLLFGRVVTHCHFDNLRCLLEYCERVCQTWWSETKVESAKVDEVLDVTLDADVLHNLQSSSEKVRAVVLVWQRSWTMCVRPGKPYHPLCNLSSWCIESKKFVNMLC